jgi:hypothetical protein
VFPSHGDAVVISGAIEFFGHGENGARAGDDAELAPLAALFVYEHFFHWLLLVLNENSHSIKPVLYFFLVGTINITVVQFFCKAKSIMTKKPVIFFILATMPAFLAGPLPCRAAEGAVTDTLASGDRAVVSGDYVRVRSGPTLEHRILDKVNSGTEVTVLARGDKPQKIGDSTCYWYQVKLDSRELSGWVYGAFLEKREPAGKAAEPGNAEPPVVSTSPPTQPESAMTAEAARDIELTRRIRLEEIGVIDEGNSQVTSGDLDGNGKPELLFLERDKRGRSAVLNGYEKSPSGFDMVYSVDMQSTRAGGVEVLSTKTLERAFLAAQSAEGRGYSGRAASGAAAGRSSSSGRLSSRGPLHATYTSLYTYDAGRSALRLVTRLNTPSIALGTLDGRNPFLVYLRRSRSADGDGTATYILETVRIEARGGRFPQKDGRIIFKERYRYEKPLPVKKLTLFDLDDDGQDEIIAEIGGRDMGGGIAILELRNGSIARLVNSGIPTYNDSPFLSLWGAWVAGKPRLVAYSTDPSGAKNESSEFGFILASLSEGTLKVDRFLPVNKMLDEVNNGRRILHYVEPEEGLAGRDFPFLVIDSEGGADRTSVKKAVL